MKLVRSRIWSKLPLVLLLSLFLLASTKAYIRIETTLLGYRIGEMKQTEAELLETQSTLKMELARITTKHNLRQLAGTKADEVAKQSWASH
ncbi:MAG: hypothetical protein ACOVS5_14880 [Oligoflexus sp.]|jgi:hypothetical protein